MRTRDSGQRYGGPEEDEADAFARDWLVPPAGLEAFIAGRPKQRSSGELLIAAASVEEFAESLGVAPGIVVGRLQRDGIIPYTHLNKLKQRVEPFAA